MKKLVLLEYYRGIAAFGVAICHYFMFTSNFVSAEFLSTVFVEMFFPLSGFVLASQTLLVAQKRGSVAVFLARRWMRTLPLFLLALICAAILIKGVSVNNFLQFAFFVKFFTSAYEANNFYPVAWSLAVEEWYYFLAPVYFALFPFVPRGKNRVIYLTLGMIAALIVLKIIALVAGIDTKFFRIATWLRLDAIAIGFLFFQLNQRFEKKSWLFWALAISTPALAASLWATLSLHHDGLTQISFLLSTSVFFAGIITTLYNWEKSRRSKSIPFAIPVLPGIWLGRISYSVYLFHLVILYLMSSRQIDFGLTGYLALIALLCVVLYFAIEKPIMDMRPVYKDRSVLSI